MRANTKCRSVVEYWFRRSLLLYLIGLTKRKKGNTKRCTYDDYFDVWKLASKPAAS